MASSLLGGRTQGAPTEPRHACILHRSRRGWRVWYGQPDRRIRRISARRAWLALDALTEGIGLAGEAVQGGACLGDTLALDAHEAGIGGKRLAQALRRGI